MKSVAELVVEKKKAVKEAAVDAAPDFEALLSLIDECETARLKKDFTRCSNAKVVALAEAVIALRKAQETLLAENMRLAGVVAAASDPEKSVEALCEVLKEQHKAEPYALDEDGFPQDEDGFPTGGDKSKAGDRARTWARALLEAGEANGAGGCRLCQS